MIVFFRLEAEHTDLNKLHAELDEAQRRLMPPDRNVYEDIAADMAVTDEHYERVEGAEPYFKGRRVLKFEYGLPWRSPPGVAAAARAFGLATGTNAATVSYTSA